MKTKDLNNIKTKDSKELLKDVVNFKTQILKLKADVKTSTEKNLKKARNLKKDLAQTMTILREKEILINEAKERKGGEEIKRTNS